MDLFIKLFYFISGFIISWAMFGYPLSLKLIDKIYKNRKLIKDYNHIPSVTVMVVAHNEEKVILNKIQNVTELNYPQNKIEFIIASDNSTDRTNRIVKEYIDSHTEFKIRLFEVKARKGKTNAQNEAQKLVTTDFLVMTDANSILERDAIKELMAAFTTDDIAYVAGKLSFINKIETDIANAEANYWDNDLVSREIEGRIQTITAGNGAIYACRTKDYYSFNPILCHDLAMPPLYALRGKRAICNHDAIAYEKAGENLEDEFKRKVRMNRVLLRYILPDIRILNIFKYKWFSYFYFGHRTCRYLLWISHLVLFISNTVLVQKSTLYLITFIGQLLFYALAFLCKATKLKSKYIKLVFYYCVTIIAQWVGVFKIVTGRVKPFWEKAESTR